MASAWLASTRAVTATRTHGCIIWSCETILCIRPRYRGTRRYAPLAGIIYLEAGHGPTCCHLSNAFESATRAYCRLANGTKSDRQTDRRTDGSQRRFMPCRAGRNKMILTFVVCLFIFIHASSSRCVSRVTVCVCVCLSALKK